MSVRNVLIVGGGFTGLTAAIALAERGVEVTVIDKAQAWARVGHGLTIQGIPRIKGVIDASMLLAKWEQNPGTPDDDPGRVMGEALAALVPAP